MSDRISHFAVSRCLGQIKFTILLDLLWNLQDQLAKLDQILYTGISSVGSFRFWSRFHQNYDCHGNRKLPLTYNGENYVSMLTPSVLIRSSSNLQVTRAGIKSSRLRILARSNHIPSELSTLEHLKYFP